MKDSVRRSAIRVLAVPLAAVISLASAFAIGEGVCRALKIPYNPTRLATEFKVAKFDPELGWSYVPGMSAVHRFGYTDRKVPVAFDENGFRAPNPDYQLDPKKPSALFIGCSYTMGHGIFYEESFAGQFSTIPNLPLQVVNLGVQAYGTDQAMLALKRHVGRFNTKLVVYTFADFHLERNGNYDRRQLYPNFKFVGTKPLFKLNRQGELYLARKPVLYEQYRFSWLWDMIQIRLGRLLGFFPPKPKDLTRELIREIKRICNAHGVRFIVIHWRWKDDGLGDLFKDLGVDVIDALTDAPPDWSKMRLYDGHPDPRAGTHVAKLLFRHLYLPAADRIT